ncbi:putative beta-carotene-binding protein [Schistocerca americana]|uniref:putative beta-carotene-binding protein n=1 Tax=Schistocerca americana TaxID=7009 RepID=UPI001F4FEC65|nr:putative beta-carotene-binding protein [Schistocerca americana]
MRHQLVPFFLLVAGMAVAELVAPLLFKTCADDEHNVAECRRQALQEVIPLLATGIPEIGAPPIDPADQLAPLTWHTSSTGLDITFRLDNGRFSGLGSAVVDSLQVDSFSKRIRIVAHSDGIYTLEGAYTLAAHVLGIPLEGTGIFKSVMGGGAVDVTYSGHLESGQGGRSYLKLDTVQVALALGRSQYELTGLFGDYQPLVLAGNMFINNVAANVVEPNLKPTLEKWLAEVFRPYAQAVFDTVPYDELFPKTPAYRGFYRAVFPHNF